LRGREEAHGQDAGRAARRTLRARATWVILTIWSPSPTFP
jgi:hypothetical protein